MWLLYLIKKNNKSNCLIKLIKEEFILAGAASGFIQKDTQDIITIKHVGTYVWKR